MKRLSFNRLSAILFFLLLVVGAVYCLQILSENIASGKYFLQPEQLRQEIALLVSYLLIIFLVLRYGYYLAVDRVNWQTLKDDFLFLLNRKYFTKQQWLINVFLFWLALIGFIYSLAVSATKGAL